MNYSQPLSKFISSMCVLVLCGHTIHAAVEDISLTGTIRISNKYVRVTINNASQQGVLIKDFWQGFSKGKFISHKILERKQLQNFHSNLIFEDVFSRGRHWINLQGKSKDDYPSVNDVVHMHLSVSEVQEKSLLIAQGGDRVELEIYCAILGDKIPSQQDWKPYRLVLEFKSK